METDWLLDEIATGLQKLATCSLERTPASELLAVTAMTWLEAMTMDRVWNEKRDAPRVRNAFATLARERTAWPAVRHLLDALPRVQPPKMLTNRATHTDAHRERMLEKVRAGAAGLFEAPEAEKQRKPDETLTEEQIRAREFAAGRDAALAGRTADACPHRATDPASGRKTTAWLDGFWSVAESAA